MAEDNPTKDLEHASDCWCIFITSPRSFPKVQSTFACSSEEGEWCLAKCSPISTLGLRMEGTVITTAVGLRLGTPLCLEHICQHCGQDVDASGTHGLSCRRSQGQIPRHSALNDVIKHSLAAINIPATLESKGLCHGNGRRPDGVTIIPWKSGRALVWDVTCQDTFAPSNIPLSCSSAGRVANEAAKNKCRTYADLRQSHHFVPFLIEIAHRLRSQSGDSLAFPRLCQWISVCIQRFYSVSILGTSPVS